MEIDRFFNAKYEEHDRYWWKGPNRYLTQPDDHPASLVTRAMLREALKRHSGRALDLGGGEGSDSIRLAQLGWRVDLVDASGAGTSKSAGFASDIGVDVNVITCRIEDFRPGRYYDLVVCNGALHYLRDKRQVIRMMQDLTVPGGINAVSLWSSFSPVPMAHRVLPCYPDDEDGITVDMYSKWDKPLLYFERLKQEAAHVDFLPHVHSYIKLVAIKPL